MTHKHAQKWYRFLDRFRRRTTTRGFTHRIDTYRVTQKEGANG